MKNEIISAGRDEHSMWIVSAAGFMKLTGELRWSKEGVLQQAWQNQSNGEITWRDVPYEIDTEYVDAEPSETIVGDEKQK